MSVRTALRAVSALFIILALSCTCALADPGNGDEDGIYPDITGHWAEASMREAQEQGVIQGDGRNLFPDEPISAAQVTAILVRALGGSGLGATPGALIPSGKWYSQDLAVAEFMGFLPSGIADYNAPLPRVTALRMVLDAFAMNSAIPDLTLIEPFNDILEYDAFTRIIMADAITSKLTVGDRGALRAWDNITRAEFITVLFRAARQFGGADEALSVPAFDTVIHNDADLANRSFKNNIWFGIGASDISLENIRGRCLTIRSGSLKELFIDAATSLDKLVLASYGEDIELEMRAEKIPHIVVGNGSGAVRIGGSLSLLEISGSGRKIELDGEFGEIHIGGFGNTIRMSSETAVDSIVLAGDGCSFEINGKIIEFTLHGEQAEFSGTGIVEACVVTAPDFDPEGQNIFARITDTRDAGLGGVSLSLSAPKILPAGQVLTATAELSGPLARFAYAVWHIDGQLAGSSACGAGERAVTLEYDGYEYTKNMPLGSEISVTWYYTTVTGKTQTKSAKTSVELENYGEDYYYQFDEERVLGLVTSVYMGNYTLEYAEENDYADFEKEIWVNAKGYSSDSDYLLWVNLACQRVNIFEGSSGEWRLVRSCIVGTGAPGTGTPVGIWKTTYKQEYGWTTGTYTVRPVVRFRGGGYAFHSRLYYPNTWTLNDPSIGFPVSHGCVRMYQEDIEWIFDNVPDGTTVVVF